MINLKQQFAELKENTPKHIQWLLLGAAFVVVIILLTLLFSGEKKPNLSDTNKSVPTLKIDPDIINWSDIVVGQKKTQPIKITATAPVKIKDVRLHKEIKGFHITDTCKAIRQINDKVACVITAIYEPTTTASTEQLPIFIDWHDATESDTITHSDKIVLSLGATSPVIEKKADPVKEIKETKTVAEEKQEKVSEPKSEEKLDPVPAVQDVADISEPDEIINKPETKPVKQEIKKEIESIAPAIKFEEEDTYTRPPESCSDFAFPGYDNSGRQIGWIKPEAGAYKFHPFSDTECDTPTGIYNPDTGIITDINSKGKRIGTDAEHIGRAIMIDGKIPELSNAPAIKKVNRARQLSNDELDLGGVATTGKGAGRLTKDGMTDFSNTLNPAPAPKVSYKSTGDTVVSSMIHDRQFLLRQYKPIPATIVSDVRADPEALNNNYLPVRATVDRNVYSDSGRNVIIPTGTLMLGYVTGEIPGPYTSIGRMNIKWYQFILPNGVEFNFNGEDQHPFSGDAQGRAGIPGYGSTDYLEQFFMPMLTAIVPATVNLIAPISDAFVNQIDLDNNTVVQSGTMRSSEMAKNEIISAWNSVAQKLLVDMMDNTVPPFSIAAGTRITVYSPVDLMVTCDEPSSGRKCAVAEYGPNRRNTTHNKVTADYTDGSWVGQARSFNIGKYCVTKGGKKTADEKCQDPSECDGYDYRTVLMYCESLNYKTKTEVKMDAYKASSEENYQKTYGGGYNEETGKFQGTKEQQTAYDEMVGITYDDNGVVENPFGSPEPSAPAEPVLTCMDGSLPDANGCCAGEIYTDMGEMGFNCCPETGGDCFPPIV